ncbi:hypothetical protein PIB30_062664 [Stylosanthes scabra]|uniref:Uncharacterized protein n=1 Tax=Stylosanthes scabra TaxID=79078 RepID=A0ABU6RL98_9FABA|nr:hypothetical protein [Stylosanthes scabra]
MISCNNRPLPPPCLWIPYPNLESAAEPTDNIPGQRSSSPLPYQVNAYAACVQVLFLSSCISKITTSLLC